MHFEEENERARSTLDGVEAALRAEGRLEPVGPDRDERRMWRAFDLAALVEGCFHEVVDPARLHDADVELWQRRIGRSFVVRPLDEWLDDQLGHERHYWLLDRTRRVGTITFARRPYSGPWLHVQSLYVVPEHRGRGLAGGALDRLAGEALLRGLTGARLGTSWTWQGWRAEAERTVEKKGPR